MLKETLRPPHRLTNDKEPRVNKVIKTISMDCACAWIVHHTNMVNGILRSIEHGRTFYRKSSVKNKKIFVM